jgi:hypothetical protein
MLSHEDLQAAVHWESRLRRYADLQLNSAAAIIAKGWYKPGERQVEAGHRSNAEKVLKEAELLAKLIAEVRRLQLLETLHVTSTKVLHKLKLQDDGKYYIR